MRSKQVEHPEILKNKGPFDGGPGLLGKIRKISVDFLWSFFRIDSFDGFRVLKFSLFDFSHFHNHS